MNSANRFALDNCIKCSICMANCPVARVSDKFAGPKQNGPDLERFRLIESAAVHPSTDYCSNCKNCDIVCPSGVNVSAMNCKAKGELVALEGAPFRDQMLASVEMLGKIGCIAPTLVNWSTKSKPLRWLGQKLLGINAQMTMPRYARKNFYDLYNLKYKTNKQDDSEHKVVYYPGCFVTYNTPEVGLALVEIMNANGIQVIVDQFNCCGLPLIANGILTKAETYAQKNIQKLQSYINRGYKIITSCPSCNLTLKQEYQELFSIDTSSLNDKIIDVFEYLQSLAQQEKLNTNFNTLSLQLSYHQPCHLKALGCSIPSKEILGLVPGLLIYDLDAGCCGLSGSYGFKQEKYPISMEIGQDLFNAVKSKQVKQVITECGTCQLQIQHGTGAAVYHPIQVLAEAYGLGKYIK